LKNYTATVFGNGLVFGPTVNYLAYLKHREI